MSTFVTLKIPTFSDERGILSVLDGVLPFTAVRIYWISGAEGQTRGGHRHKKTRQALVSLHGAILIYLNNGITEQTVLLDSSDWCLLVEPEDWHTMTFGSDSVLLVLASHSYDVEDYIDEAYARAIQNN
jgi:dTDP-4-dehydrorhamnose 3,5-epimerase-like enzyme